MTSQTPAPPREVLNTLAAEEQFVSRIFGFYDRWGTISTANLGDSEEIQANISINFYNDEKPTKHKYPKSKELLRAIWHRWRPLWIPVLVVMRKKTIEKFVSIGIVESMIEDRAQNLVIHPVVARFEQKYPNLYAISSHDNLVGQQLLGNKARKRKRDDSSAGDSEAGRKLVALIDANADGGLDAASCLLQSSRLQSSTENAQQSSPMASIAHRETRNGDLLEGAQKYYSSDTRPRGIPQSGSSVRHDCQTSSDFVTPVSVISESDVRYSNQDRAASKSPPEGLSSPTQASREHRSQTEREYGTVSQHWLETQPLQNWPSGGQPVPAGEQYGRDTSDTQFAFEQQIEVSNYSETPGALDPLLYSTVNFPRYLGNEWSK